MKAFTHGCLYIRILTFSYYDLFGLTKLTNSLELINTWTPEYKGVDVDEHFYNLSIEENTKPCLFLVTNTTENEYNSMLAMNLFSLTINNMVTLL